MSRILSKLTNVNVFNEEDWEEMMNFMEERMIKFKKILRPYLNDFSPKNRKDENEI